MNLIRPRRSGKIMGSGFEAGNYIASSALNKRTSLSDVNSKGSLPPEGRLLLPWNIYKINKSEWKKLAPAFWEIIKGGDFEEGGDFFFPIEMKDLAVEFVKSEGGNKAGPRIYIAEGELSVRSLTFLDSQNNNQPAICLSPRILQIFNKTELIAAALSDVGILKEIAQSCKTIPTVAIKKKNSSSPADSPVEKKERMHIPKLAPTIKRMVKPVLILALILPFILERLNIGFNLNHRGFIPRSLLRKSYLG